MKKYTKITDPRHLLYGMFLLPSLQEKPERSKPSYIAHNNKFDELTEEERLFIRDAPLTLRQITEELGLDIKEDTIGHWRRRLKREALDAKKRLRQEEDDDV